MGSLIEINDTLQITKEQGFPRELNLENHLKNSIKVEDFQDKVKEEILSAYKDSLNNRLTQVIHF